MIDIRRSREISSKNEGKSLSDRSYFHSHTHKYPRAILQINDRIDPPLTSSFNICPNLSDNRRRDAENRGNKLEANKRYKLLKASPLSYTRTHTREDRTESSSCYKARVVAN